MTQIRNIGFLFDLDGVLIDSEKEYSRMWAQVNREYPSGTDSLEVVIKGCTLDKILADHYPDCDMQEKVVSRLYELEKKMKYDYMPGAQRLLLALKDMNVPMALVTSSNEVKMAHLKEELPESRDMFDFLVTADLITKSKPDPEGYLLGAKKIDKDIRNCVVFEDSLQGVKAGQNSGAYVIGVAGTLPRDVLAPYADRVVDSMEEIDVVDLINLLGSR